MVLTLSGCQASQGCERKEQCARYHRFLHSTPYEGFNAYQTCRVSEFVQNNYPHFVPTPEAAMVELVRLDVYCDGRNFMQHLKKIIVPAVQEHTKEALDFTSCDLCGNKMNIHQWGDKFNIDEVTIERRLGNSWPECGDTITTSFDVCGTCFVEKVIPWMESQGAQPTVTEQDW